MRERFKSLNIKDLNIYDESSIEHEEWKNSLAFNGTYIW